ncbi:hypothetical protein ASPBRDRAFT_57534 [Aspergillus brasiliensis CBS 101740]|uniref:Uncharacterized protein n=1 Tax=Aspergillus brasiliensis (strain CBS 101740 / IMI 381727 / IBT 21946) TaxID=767769 RepID=A0A1L9UBK1_ASPBC|nr:hypothetical protein ASPBRDRAFT_57534 [Aspergillus brasiliensis CBS 101740]
MSPKAQPPALREAEWGRVGAQSETNRRRRVSVLLAVVALPPYASCCWLPARDHHVKGVTAWHTAKEGASMAPSLVDVLPDRVTVPEFTAANMETVIILSNGQNAPHIN